MIDQLITWIDQHDGFMMFVATVIYAVITGILARQAHNANKMTKAALEAEQASREERRVENHIFHLFEQVRMARDEINIDLHDLPSRGESAATAERYQKGSSALDILWTCSKKQIEKDDFTQYISVHLNRLRKSLFFAIQYIDEAKIPEEFKQTYINILNTIFSHQQLQLIKFYINNSAYLEFEPRDRVEILQKVDQFLDDIYFEQPEFCDSQST